MFTVCLRLRGLSVGWHSGMKWSKTRANVGRPRRLYRLAQRDYIDIAKLSFELMNGQCPPRMLEID